MSEFLCCSPLDHCDIANNETAQQWISSLQFSINLDKAIKFAACWSTSFSGSYSITKCWVLMNSDKYCIECVKNIPSSYQLGCIARARDMQKSIRVYVLSLTWHCRIQQYQWIEYGEGIWAAGWRRWSWLRIGWQQSVQRLPESDQGYCWGKNQACEYT